MNEQEGDNRFSLVPRPSHELIAPQIGANRILGEMVESSLALAKEAAPTGIDLDALVREAKRIQGKAAGMTTETVRAFELFLRAARAGHPEAQREVGMCFGFGVGARYDIDESDRWFRLAAEQGDAEAQSMLGMYRPGSDAESIKWLRKAAEQGHSLTQMTLGARYSAGRRVPQDYCEAYAWYQLATDAEAADPDAEAPPVTGAGWFEAQAGAGWFQKQATGVAKSAELLSPSHLDKARALYLDFKRKYSAKR